MIRYTNYCGIELEVHFDYDPEEESTHDYPGCGSEMSVYKVLVNDVDIYDLVEQHVEEIGNQIENELLDR